MAERHGHGVARVASLALELRTLAAEQAALRRVATLVARAAPPATVFAAVTEEVGRLLVADRAYTCRYDADDRMTLIAAWSASGEALPAFQGPIEPGTLADRVRRTARPARVDDFTDAAVVRLGIRSSVVTPITVEGRTWGHIGVVSTTDEPPPPDAETRLAGFTELVATALANAQSRAELEASRAESRRTAEEQAALRRVATLVAHGLPAGEIMDAVTRETRRVLGVDASSLVRLESDGSITFVAADSRRPVVLGVGRRLLPEAGTSVAEVLRTGRPARVEAYAGAPGSLPEQLRSAGYRGSAGAPVIVNGRMWGVMVVSSAQADATPPGSEARLMQFTELVATAIANAQVQAELTASRARVVAAADETRRRIERELHDGAQQHLVAVSLRLRAARAAVPPELTELARELDGVTVGLERTLGELREFARGIHPAILAEGGLAPALKVLARRCAVPAEPRVRLEGRLPERVEVCAYYVVSEALANAAKHALASTAVVDVEVAEDVLRVSVRDDGIGGARFTPGSGLVGLKDRVEALGGRIRLDSPPGAGTALEAELPMGSRRG